MIAPNYNGALRRQVVVLLISIAATALIAISGSSIGYRISIASRLTGIERDVQANRENRMRIEKHLEVFDNKIERMESKIDKILGLIRAGNFED